MLGEKEQNPFLFCEQNPDPSVSFHFHHSLHDLLTAYAALQQLYTLLYTLHAHTEYNSHFEPRRVLLLYP